MPEYKDISSVKKEGKDNIRKLKTERKEGGENKPSRSDIRSERKNTRAAVKDQRNENVVVDSANQQGIDLNKKPEIPHKAMSENYKRNLYREASNLVDDEDKQKLVSFIKSTPGANYKDAPNIDVDAEKRKARAQRIAAVGGAISGFGKGLQGKSMDYSKSLSAQMGNERDQRFKDYKDVTEANKQTETAWKYNTRKEALDWVSKQLEQKNLDESEKKKYKYMYDKLQSEQDALKSKLGLEREKLAANKKMHDQDLGIEQEKLRLQKIKDGVPLNQQTQQISDLAMSSQGFKENHPDMFKKEPIYKTQQTTDAQGFSTEEQVFDGYNYIPMKGITAESMAEAYKSYVEEQQTLSTSRGDSGMSFPTATESNNQNDTLGLGF